MIFEKLFGKPKETEVQREAMALSMRMIEAKKGLEKLERLTEQTDFSFISSIDTKQVITVDVGPDAISSGYSVLNNGDVAVVHGYTSEGGKTQGYTLTTVDILIVYKGRVEVRTPGRLTCLGAHFSSIILQAGDVMRFAPNEKRTLIALEDTKFLSVTIPAAPDYPEESVTVPFQSLVTS